MLAALEADRLRVAEVQTQILQLERSLLELRIQHSQAQERLDSYKYPVLTLPNEIISEIFLHVLPSHPDFPPLTGLSSPNLLTRICRQWREIALRTPLLWSAISSLDHYAGHSEARAFRLWLERSRCCPLYLRVGTNTTWATDEVLEAVLSHSTRWQYLEMDLQALDGRVLGSPMPLLRHLELMVGDDPHDSVSLREVPLLRTVALGHIPALRVILPWAQLTTLTLCDLLPSECVPILLQTPNLVHFTLRLYFTPSPDNPDRRDISLPYLESLIMFDLERHSLVDFLPAFIVPALRSLEIPERFLAHNPIDSLTAFISKSGCTLETLHITWSKLTPRTSYRQAFPSLRKLSFSSSNSSDGEDSSDSDSSDG
ncbi:hypothetical protein DFH06DRAFT_1338073 [Mycena polygramma]|nr:hypothetical protein DFH06DRAFT_1338073 [Mycena polygramma]